MRRSPSAGFFDPQVFTPRRVRIGAGVAAGVGAVALSIALIGATAAPAATQPANAGARGLLQIRYAAPEPIVMPAPPKAGEQMAVLADAPADLAEDPDLQSSRDLALIRQADAVQAHDAQVQASLWSAEEARMQAQIDAATKPPSDAPSATAPNPAGPSGDPDVTAAAGDTRKAQPTAS